ncbi:uncharacterized protein RAG0_16650 [Rhynchosporium agropyri]|uniref:AA1-like domain-containing protein n=1 Tax=Rhynchosporium agropyri TaxID=914238 RepID=A0A1E1LRF4_9HELO|nr:uncharacterized protein RAG0_16650 [Rhynchosporium agropyri]
MFFSRSLALTAAVLASHAIAQQCESAKKLCYNAPDSTPQNVTVEDIKSVAQYLRSYGLETKAGRQFTMTAEAAPDCSEWTLFNNGTVIALAQHINSKVDSSVFYTDIANTIDGGFEATQEKQKASLLGCGTTGGTMGVVYNASAEQYHTAAYFATGYTPAGIMIKIVHS